MITPEEIRKKATRLYHRYLQAWICREAPSFPIDLERVNLSLRDLNHKQQIRAVEELDSRSKQVRGFGYSVRKEKCNSPIRGKNSEPRGLCFETLDDLLRFTGKKAEFERTARVAERVRQEFPQLEQWVRENVLKLHSYDESLEDLLAVAQFFVKNPRPQLYIRQLPLPVDTKFIERNKPKLRKWLDVLVPESVDVNETRFEPRYGLREKAIDVKCRILDPALQPAIGVHHEEFSLPLHHLQQLGLREVTVLIVENEMNLLTLPLQRRTFAMWGRGDWVAKFHQLQWLHDCRIIYWGDLDVEGFEALASLRKYFGEAVESFLMDDRCVREYAHLAIDWQNTVIGEPSLLSPAEMSAFRWCRDQQKRVEQERIPQLAVDCALHALETCASEAPRAGRTHS